MHFRVVIDNGGYIFFIFHLHAEIFQHLDVPRRAAVGADAQGVFDAVAGVYKLLTDIGVDVFLIVVAREVSLAVVTVEVHEKSAGLQDSVPLVVGFHCIGESPREVAADDGIKGVVVKVRFLGVHLLEFCTDTERNCVELCLMKHVCGHVYARHVMAQLCEKNREEACACADIQYLEGSPCRQMFG